MKKIYCSHPVFIFNKKAKNLILRFKNYTLRGVLYHLPERLVSEWYCFFPYGLFSAKKNAISYDNIDDFYVTDFSTGETFPLFMAVPCGKCLLCRDKKSQDWGLRATCESLYSKTLPLFVTLTYNDVTYPAYGLDKVAVQNFFKRLRINLERLNYDCSGLRYFACGEYGSHPNYGHRAHYHLVLWNFPNMRWDSAHDIVRKSWSFQVSKKAYHVFDSYVSDFLSKIPKHKHSQYEQFIRFTETYKDRLYHRIAYGKVDVKPVTKGCISYVMKYMKKAFSVPAGKQPLFFLSSRKNGGLGAAWLRDNISHYRNNVDDLVIEVRDPYTNKIVRGGLPAYFKNKIFPTASLLVPKEVRDDFSQYVYLNNHLSWICRKLGYNRDAHGFCSPKLLDTFRIVDTFFPESVPSFMNSITHLVKHDKLCGSDLLDNYFREISSQIRDLELSLLEVVLDTDSCEYLLELGEQRKAKISLYLSQMPEIDISVCENKLKDYQNRMRYKEKF